MGKVIKLSAIFLILFCLTCLLLLPIGSVEAQATIDSAPTIAWQQEYGIDNVYDGTGVEVASNLIQTNDDGYIFMDLGWSYQFSFEPSTVLKVDSLGNSQWNKTISYLEASTIIQTNDNGYEIAGKWSTYGTTYKYTPTLIKLDHQGNIQWVKNYTSIPDFGINSTMIQTSDGGFAYKSPFNEIATESGSITKTDATGYIQWVMNLTYTGNDGTRQLALTSVIETSDGSFAALGVGYNLFDNPRTGRIYLIKTEPFLPTPSPSQLPTPIPTPLAIGNLVSITAILIFALIVIFAISLLIYRRHRKTAKISNSLG